ncbi:MAG: MFS transporter [Planctomycetes bacterium]|jgi:MFS family permease|nr:MFS transporter [Planctomycetota bacterium]
MLKNKLSLKILYGLGLIFAVSIALPAYIESSFLEQFVSVEKISWFFLIANLVSFLILMTSHILIKKIGNYRLTKIFILFNLVSLLALSSSFFTNSIWSVLFFFTVFIICSYVIPTNLDIFIESFSLNNKTGRIRTMFLTATNLGWIAMPIVSGFLLKSGGFRTIFLLALGVVFIFALVFWKNKKNIDKKIKYSEINISETISTIWRRPNLKGIFFISFLLNLFFSMAVVFMPLYLNQYFGFSWQTIGYMFSFMLLPFVLIEIPAGIIADKYGAEKRLLALGFVILVVSCLIWALTDSTSPFVWALLLFMSRCGAALAESMRDSYFFKHVSAKDASIIKFFRNTGPLAYVFGSIISLVLLKFYSINYLFLFLAILVFSGFYFIFLIRNGKEKIIKV